MHSKNTKGFFVTGTDTGIGKTLVTRTLIVKLQQQGFKALGCKPLACGINDLGENEDVATYQTINSCPLAKEKINPICLDLPVSPNIAAKAANFDLQLATFIPTLKSVMSMSVDYIFYEGVGGWKVPINETETLADLARALDLPILLIIGLRVGCLNHALLTYEAISRDNLRIAGWIGNVIEKNMPALDQHINTLSEKMAAPYLGTVPYLQNPNDSHLFFNIAPFLEIKPK